MCHINMPFIFCSLEVSQYLPLYNSIKCTVCVWGKRNRRYLSPSSFLSHGASSTSEFLGDNERVNHYCNQNKQCFVPSDGSGLKMVVHGLHHILISLHLCLQPPIQLPKSIESTLLLTYLLSLHNQCHQPVLCL